jgi:hypothetical protein
MSRTQFSTYYVLFLGINEREKGNWGGQNGERGYVPEVARSYGRRKRGIVAAGFIMVETWTWIVVDRANKPSGRVTWKNILKGE